MRPRFFRGKSTHGSGVWSCLGRAGLVCGLATEQRPRLCHVHEAALMPGVPLTEERPRLECSLSLSRALAMCTSRLCGIRSMLCYVKAVRYYESATSRLR